MICVAGSAMFDALQCEFFGQNVGEQVEFGGLENEGDNNTPVFGTSCIYCNCENFVSWFAFKRLKSYQFLLTKQNIQISIHKTLAQHIDLSNEASLSILAFSVATPSLVV